MKLMILAAVATFAALLYFGVDKHDKTYDNIEWKSVSATPATSVAKGYSKAAIQQCWKEHERRSLTPNDKRSIAEVCEMMEGR